MANVVHSGIDVSSRCSIANCSLILNQNIFYSSHLLTCEPADAFSSCFRSAAFGTGLFTVQDEPALGNWNGKALKRSYASALCLCTLH